MNFNKIALGLTLAAFAGGANATLVNVSGTNNLQAELDNITYSSTNAVAANSVSFLDVNTDQAVPDEVFAMGATFSTSSRLVFEFAGNHASNTFGIYDINNMSNTLEIFGGSATTNSFGLVYDAATNLFTNAGGTDAQFSSNLFGYYLGTGNGTFYSQSSLNGGGADQMVSYEGGDGLYLDINSNGIAGVFAANEYLLAFEDIVLGSSDSDYNDFVVLVESVEAVSAPATLALFGLGLLGMGAAARKRKQA